MGKKNTIARIKAIILLPPKQRYHELLNMMSNPRDDEIEVVDFLSNVLISIICSKYLRISREEFNYAIIDDNEGDKLQSTIRDFIKKRNGNLLVFDDIDLITNALNSYVDT
jgi:hypothetical protein